MEVREEVRQLAEPLAEELGFEVVDVEHSVQGRQRILRVLLDKPGGVTVGDCSKFSRRLSDCLDMNQTLPNSYMLEVSSPGIDRPIRSLDAVARFSGQRVTLTSHEMVDGRRNFEGLLLGPDSGRAGIRTDDGKEYWFEWRSVRTTRLVVDPWARSKEQSNRGAHHGTDGAPEDPGARRTDGGAR